MVYSLSLVDTTRLQTLIQILASEVSSDLSDSGHRYAMTHAASTLQSCAASRELMSGLTQVCSRATSVFEDDDTDGGHSVMMVMCCIIVMLTLFSEKSAY